MKPVRVLIAAAIALVAAAAVQLASSSGASAATTIHITPSDCGTCWQIVHD